MTSTRFALHSLLPMVLAFAFMRPILMQSPKADAGLTVEEVVKMSQTGIPEELIITKIKKNGKAFDLSSQELVELKKLGVSEKVIKFLLDPSQPYTPPAPPAIAPTQLPASGAKSSDAPKKKYPADAFASRVPSDSGLYLFLSNNPMKIDVRLLLGTEVGKALKKKGKTIAYLVGPASKTRIKDPRPVFYMRLPDGIEIEQLVLMTMTQKSDRREIDVGDLKPDVMRSFDIIEVAPRLFKMTTAKLATGEYLFLIVGSADTSKGIHGKGYDFGIEDVQDRNNTS